MIQTKTRTLQLEFADAAVSTLLEKKIFATAEGELTALKDSRIITRQVETLDE